MYVLQYHPEITYHKMITLIKFRKDKLFVRENVLKMKKKFKNTLILLKKKLKFLQDQEC